MVWEADFGRFVICELGFHVMAIFIYTFKGHAPAYKKITASPLSDVSAGPKKSEGIIILKAGSHNTSGILGRSRTRACYGDLGDANWPIDKNKSGSPWARAMTCVVATL